MSIENLLNKKKLDSFNLDELARYCGYDSWVDFCEYVNDNWNWHMDELCSDEPLPYKSFLLEEAREKVESAKAQPSKQSVGKMMSEKEGKWVWLEGGEKTHQELCIEPLGEYDSILYHGADWPISEKYKRLIAAAPKLLAVLQQTHKDYKEFAETGNGNLFDERLGANMEDAETVIAEAMTVPSDKPTEIFTETQLRKNYANYVVSRIPFDDELLSYEQFKKSLIAENEPETA